MSNDASAKRTVPRRPRREKSKTHPYKYRWKKTFLENASRSAYGSTQLAVMWVVWDRFGDKDPVCYDSHEAIAHRARTSRSTVVRTLKDMEADGWLAKKARNGRRNEYRPVIPEEIDLFVVDGAVARLTPDDLALRFREKAETLREAHPLAVGDTNLEGLRAHMNRWIEGGLSTAQILAMIDLFNTGHLREGFPAWRRFISCHDLLARKAVEVAEETLDPSLGWAKPEAPVEVRRQKAREAEEGRVEW